MSKKDKALMFALLWLIAGLVSDSVIFVAFCMAMVIANSVIHILEAWKEFKK